MDQRKPDGDLPLKVPTGDVSDETTLRESLYGKQAVISCLPYFLNIKIAEIAVETAVHYFDLTEDVPTLNAVRKLSENSNSVLAPQCGLAPGFIGILGAALY